MTAANAAPKPAAKATPKAAKPSKGASADATGVSVQEAQAVSKAKPVSKDEPKAAEAVATDADKPATLSAARGGKADDLKLIKGVGPKLEELLYTLGFYHFDQIAAWNANELAWVDQNLEGFKGRASRDEWIDQAEKLATGAETEFSARAKKKTGSITTKSTGR